MAKEEWAVSGTYLLKALNDLAAQGHNEQIFPELLGYCDDKDLNEAVEVAKKIPAKKLTPTKSVSELNNPDYNFVPDFFVINDFLAHTLYEETILFMTKEYFDKHHEENDWGYDLEWEDLVEDEEDYVYCKIGKEAFDEFEEPMVTTFIDRLIYADGEPVEFDDILEHNGNLKKHFLDLDNSFWYGKSFVAQRYSGVNTPYGIQDN